MKYYSYIATLSFLLISSISFTLTAQSGDEWIDQFPESTLDNLSSQLDVLSDGLDISSVGLANQIITDNISIPEEHWTQFFSDYFATNGVSEEMLDYLSIPSFELPDTEVNEKIQGAVLGALINRNDDLILNSFNVAISMAMDSEFRNEVMNINEYFQLYFDNYNPAVPDDFQSILNCYSVILEENEDYLQKPNVIDPENYPYIGDLRSQFFSNMAAMAKLNMSYKPQVRNVTGIAESPNLAERILFDQYGIIVADLGKFTNEQFERVIDILDASPSNLRSVFIATLEENLSGDFDIKSQGGLNLTEVELGTATLEEFPDEVDAFPTDVFTVRLVNELGKNIDEYGLQEQNHFLAEHKEELLANAGNNAENFLRSIPDGGYYLQYPNRFLADIGNMYFSNSYLTWECALTKSMNGNHNPMDQFLLLANIMSGETNEVPFMTFNHLSPIVSTDIEAVKNADGYITHLYVNDFGCPYEFVLDSDNKLQEVILPVPTLEIPYNGIDDDCDPNTKDDDLDYDGFTADQDCNDSNPYVNPFNAEVQYNGLDDDCDPETLDDDIDQDGFAASEECDDNNPHVFPGASEVAYNGIDDDCNPETLDDDLDQDGYSIGEECHDNDPNINPGMEDIPNNGIDEDCDGEDMIVSIDELGEAISIEIYPNPVNDALQIKNLPAEQLSVQLFDSAGRLILSQSVVSNELDLSSLETGVYIIEFRKASGAVFSQRLMKQ